MVTETVTRDGAVLPVQIRTSRKLRICERCHRQIQRGDRYEDQRMPPWQEFNDTPYWRRLTCHVNAYPAGVGCDEAAAYAEHARREAVAIIPDEDTIIARDGQFGAGLDTWEF